MTNSGRHIVKLDHPYDITSLHLRVFDYDSDKDYRIGRPTHFEYSDAVHGSYYVRWSYYVMAHRIGGPSYVYRDRMKNIYEICGDIYIERVLRYLDMMVCELCYNEMLIYGPLV